MIQAEQSEKPREVIFQEILDGMDVSYPDPTEGDWDDRVGKLLDGEFFLDQLKQYVNKPMIVDHIEDRGYDHGLRREWRLWAFDAIDGFQTEYESNSLRMNHIQKLQGIVDLLLDIEKDSGNLAEDEIKLLENTKKKIEEATTILPGKFDKLTVQEAMAYTLKNLIEIGSLPDDLDVTRVINSLDMDLNQIISEIEDKESILNNYLLSIIKFVKENYNFDDDEITKLKRKIVGAIRPQLTGPTRYDTPEFTTQHKVKLVQDISKNLREFLSGFIKE